jgi:hypothetical protein
MLALARQHKTTVFAQAAGAREGAPSGCPGVSASARHGVPQRSWWSHVPCCCCSLSFRMPPRSSKPSTITWEYVSDQDGLPVRPHWLLHINLTFPPHLPLKLLCHSLGVQKLPGGAPLTTIFQPLGVVKFTRISRSKHTPGPPWVAIPLSVPTPQDGLTEQDVLETDDDDEWTAPAVGRRP